MVIPRTLLVLLLLSGCSDDTGAADAGADRGVDSTLADSAVDLVSPDLGADAIVTPDSAPDQATPADLGPLGDGINITCTATVGTGSVSGSVGGQPLSAVSAGGVRAVAWGITAYGIALLDQPGTCAGLAQSMTAPKLWILVCDNKPGTYAIGDTCKGDAGAGFYLQNQVSIPATGTDPKATSGTITIDALNPDCGGKVKGSFSVTFGSEAVTGSFDTVGCGTINL